MLRSLKGFTLIELMVVILIVAILAAVSIPLMKGKSDSAKWAEANSAAGIIQNAVRVYFHDTNDNAGVIGNLANQAIRAKLGFDAQDLEGTYFTTGDYRITFVNLQGEATVEVTASKSNAPTGSMSLSYDGRWE